MLTPSQQQCYLARINVDMPQPLSLSSLQTLMQAHLYHVPFENLDIPLGKTLSLEYNDLFSKIIENKRGGFCYEVNYLFSQLLKSFGYQINLLAANVWSNGRYGPDFDHLLIRVKLPEDDAIVDVGFGDSFRVPVPLSGEQINDGFHHYQLQQSGQEYVLVKTTGQGEQSQQYKFTLRSWTIADFSDMCRYQQTSSESQFSRNSICTIADKTGRKTISNGQLIITEHNRKTRIEYRDIDTYKQALLQHFGIELPELEINQNINKLLFRLKE
ncbi:arylamine N-acetyltransferase [Thalassotalea sp. Y01]|uniref:arylamine N-acetyltransferase family protein n=1 Tax=Thalassotalea sp. Y01 TaxID=2729613 RepID=UPI00145CBA9E|nr:arylamine N-acetyltransferase [Thalassotalea sp. Y01]NMP17896.1 arylamine N-acetyltransferase [Thalassotalea sp. Y01]